MSLIPDYANAVGSAMSYNRKAADTKGKEKTDGNASSEKTGKANKADRTDRNGDWKNDRQSETQRKSGKVL